MADRRQLDALRVEPSDDDARPVPDEPVELTEVEAADRLAALNKLLDLMRPAVQADGGDLVLVSADVATGRVEVQLRGSCSSCAISSATLEEGVARLLRQRLDWVTEVIGGVEEVDDLAASAALGRGGWVSADDVPR